MEIGTSQTEKPSIDVTVSPQHPQVLAMTTDPTPNSRVTIEDTQ